jgi:hypothetical protein
MITEVEDSTAQSSGNPVIELKLENAAGETIRDWVVYHEAFLGKVVALFDSAGLDRPVEGEYDPDDHCRLTKQKIDQLRGKTVGNVNRDEPDNRPGKTGSRRRVQGYVQPSRITDDIPTDTRGLPNANSQVQNDDSDIPFLYEPFRSEYELFHSHENR